MNNCKASIDKIVDDLIKEIIDTNINEEMHLHERYLHHRFSFLAQQAGYDISFNNKAARFHPEWATAITGVRDGGFYKGTNDGYEPRDSKKNEMNTTEGGTPGFIDFAIGDFDKPDYAVEFKMAKGMDAKGFAFDYMKLLDGRNQFKKAISLSVVFGRKTPLEQEQLDANLKAAKGKLGQYFAKGKPYRFIVIQLVDGKHYIWECNNETKEFKLKK